MVDEMCNETTCKRGNEKQYLLPKAQSRAKRFMERP